MWEDARPSFWKNKKTKYLQTSEVLGDTSVSLSWVNAGVFNASIAAGLNISNHGLVVFTTVSAVVVHIPVVGILAVVAPRGVCGRHVAFLRGFGAVGGRVSRRGIRRPTVDVTSAVISSDGGRTQYTDGLHFTRVRSSAIGILHGALAGGGTVRHGEATHSAGEVGGGLAAGGGSTPSTITGGSVVLGGHDTSHAGKGGIVVRVEPVFFDFLAAFFLVGLVRLALAPEEERGQDDQGNRDDRHNDCDGNGAIGGETGRGCGGGGGARICSRATGGGGGRGGTRAGFN